MKKYADIVIKFRMPIIVICLVLTVIFGYFIKDIRIEADFVNYLTKTDPDVEFFRQVGDEFGANYICMIALETKDIFNHGTLSRIRKITRDIEQLEDIEEVISITNILDIKKTGDGLEVGNLIDKNKIPSDISELKLLREYTLSKKIYTSNLISDDGSIAVIAVKLKEESQRDVLAKEIRKKVGSMNIEEKIYFAGFPILINYASKIILEDISRLIPIVILVVFITLFLSFRSIRGVLLPLLTVGMCTTWVVGLMAIVNVPLTMISAIMPIVLIATGTAYGIHLINRYNHGVNNELDKKSQVREALGEIGIPIMLAAITTFIGFISLLFSTMTLLRTFGLFTAIGIAMAFVCSTTFLPAVLSYLPANSGTKEKTTDKKDILDGIMSNLGKKVLKNEKPILIVVAIVTMIFILAIPRLRNEVNFLSYFRKGSEIRVAEDLIKEGFGGSTPFAIDVRGDIKNPFILKEIELLQKWIKTVPNVRNPQSVADLIAEMNNVMNDRRSIPSAEDKVGNLWFFLEGQSILNQMINQAEDEAIIQGKINEIHTGVISHTVNEINDIIQQKIKDDMVIINTDNLTEVEKPKFLRLKIQGIITRIMLDLKAVDIETTNSDMKRIEDVISKSINMDYQLTKEDKNSLLKNINDYFRGYEADIQLTTDKIITKIGRSIVSPANITKEDIINILKMNIPEEIIMEDPEAIDYTAKTLHKMMRDRHSELKSDMVLDDIINIIAGKISLKSKEHKDLLDDIKGDIWTINENEIAIGYDEYQELTKISLPDTQRIKAKYRLTGMMVILKNLEEQLISSQYQSLGLALFMVFIVLIIQLRSFVGGLIAIVPIVLTIVINFGLMSYLNIPLDIATMMIASVAIGIGIDYTIHFFSRFKIEMKRSENEITVLSNTTRTAGKAILINTITVAFGFLVLIFAGLIPLQRFGWLIAITMIISMFGAVVVFPALILLIKPKFLRKITNSK